MSERDASDRDRELEALVASSPPWTPELSVLTHLAPRRFRRRPGRSRRLLLIAVMWGVGVGLVGWAGLWWLLAPDVPPAMSNPAGAPTPPAAVLRRPVPESRPVPVEVPPTPPDPGPAPVPVARDTARPSPASEIVLRAILTSEARALAMVDAQIVGVGDVVNGLVVVDIRSDGIVVRNDAGDDAVVSIYR